MTKRKSAKPDPFAKREAGKYDNPIASREYILELLETQAGPVTHPELLELLKLTSDEDVEALRRRLIAMARDGQLFSNRHGAYSRVDQVELLRARVQAHRDGFGFAVLSDGGDDIYLHNRQMRKVFDGDEVLVRLQGTSHRGKEEGAIVEVLSRNTRKLAGRFIQESGVQFLVPENPRITQDIMIAPGKELNAKSGQIVVVEILQQPDKHIPPAGQVIEIMGDHMAPGMEIELSIQSHGIPYQWASETIKEAEALSVEVADADKLNRIDLRDEPFITIDGIDARDFDDAVLCKSKKSGGWTLFVAIADVSHYVACDSALDQDAKNRGNSVYFPDHVVPMLPEKLSNGLCSLNPHVDRLCMVCEMNISAEGVVEDYKFYEGIIHSHARMTYTQVGEILDETKVDSPLRQEFSERIIDIENLHALYKKLRLQRDERGAIDFETVETRIVFDEKRKIEQIVPVYRNDAHKLIEECMLCANVCAANFLQSHKIACLYRVHQRPTSEKLEGLREFLSELGLGLSGGDEPTSSDYQVLMKAIVGRPDANMIQTVMLRSLRQAVYQVDNNGHFGLGYDAYAHFTSPIRRYPDLLVHRAIRSVIRSDKKSAHVLRVENTAAIEQQEIYPYNVQDVLMLGEHFSLTERRADEATRDVMSWLKCEYLQDHVGSVFPGIISAATGFGIFVELKELYVEGLIHITALPHDYYSFEPAKHRLIGERTRKVFGLGDELSVRVVRVSLDERKIDFELESVDSSRSNKGASKKHSTGKKSGSGKASNKKSNQKPEVNRKGNKSPGSDDRKGTAGKKIRKRKVSDAPKADKKKVRSPKIAAVRSEEAAAPTKNKSLFAAAKAGVKKALAKIKKKNK